MVVGKYATIKKMNIPYKFAKKKKMIVEILQTSHWVVNLYLSFMLQYGRLPIFTYLESLNILISHRFSVCHMTVRRWDKCNSRGSPETAATANLSPQQPSALVTWLTGSSGEFSSRPSVMAVSGSHEDEVSTATADAAPWFCAESFTVSRSRCHRRNSKHSAGCCVPNDGGPRRRSFGSA